MTSLFKKERLSSRVNYLSLEMLIKSQRQFQVFLSKSPSGSSR
jgi:hypothetical protein